MPIPLLVAFAAIACPIAVIIVSLILNVRHQKKHSKEWFGKKSANNITMLIIVASIIVLLVSIYLLFNLGVVMN